jgi:hypothetical protein
LIGDPLILFLDEPSTVTDETENFELSFIDFN